MSRKKTTAVLLAEHLGGKWTAVRDGFGWIYESDDGRTARQYSSAVLGWDGYKDDEFNVWWSIDGWNRLDFLPQKRSLC